MIVAGRYRLSHRIGGGGVANVFEAEHLGLRRRVALKILSPSCAPDSVERLLAEASLIGAAHHPNICQISDVGHDPALGPYLVLERLFGETLDARLRRGPLSLAEAADIFTQVLSAISAVHGVHIVHRDLKPENILLVPRVGCTPLVKLVDFGFAKDLTAERSKILTRPGLTCGTPVYMAPEQLRGDLVDARADLFAVGVVLFEALTGRHPFEGPGPAGITKNILFGRRLHFREVDASLPYALEVLVGRALAGRPQARFASALAMQNALAEALPTLPAAASAHSFGGAPTQRIPVVRVDPEKWSAEARDVRSEPP